MRRLRNKTELNIDAEQMREAGDSMHILTACLRATRIDGVALTRKEITVQLDGRAGGRAGVRACERAGVRACGQMGVGTEGWTDERVKVRTERYCGRVKYVRDGQETADT